MFCHQSHVGWIRSGKSGAEPAGRRGVGDSITPMTGLVLYHHYPHWDFLRFFYSVATVKLEKEILEYRLLQTLWSYCTYIRKKNVAVQVAETKRYSIIEEESLHGTQLTGGYCGHRAGQPIAKATRPELFSSLLLHLNCTRTNCTCTVQLVPVHVQNYTVCNIIQQSLSHTWTFCTVQDSTYILLA